MRARALVVRRGTTRGTDPLEGRTALRPTLWPPETSGRRSRDSRGSAGLLLPGRGCGNPPLPPAEQVRGLCETDHERGQARERERGARDDAGVEDRRLRQHADRVEPRPEPIEEERELEHAERADPRDAESETANPRVGDARGEVCPPERRDQTAEEA